MPEGAWRSATSRPAGQASPRLVRAGGKDKITFFPCYQQGIWILHCVSTAHSQILSPPIRLFTPSPSPLPPVTAGLLSTSTSLCVCPVRSLLLSLYPTCDIVWFSAFSVWLISRSLHAVAMAGFYLFSGLGHSALHVRTRASPAKTWELVPADAVFRTPELPSQSIDAGARSGSRACGMGQVSAPRAHSPRRRRVP